MNDRESRNLRERHADLADLLDRPGSAYPASAPAMVVITVTVTTYPTTAGVFYGVQATDPGGVEAEGTSAVYGTAGGTFFALILGSVPPVGTHLVIDLVNGRWVGIW